MNTPIHLVGGGLVGSLTAIYLAQRGYDVTLHERRPDMRTATISAGRSINLAVTARGLKALREVGLYDAVMELAIPMKGRMLHALDGKTTFVPYGQKAHEVIHSVSRGELNKLLISAAESYPGVSFRFNQRCTGYDMENNLLFFHDESAHSTHAVSAHHVIGTDGAGSALRQALASKEPAFRVTEDNNSYGYKELAILPSADGGFRMEKEALHIWPRGEFMLIALPNIDGSFTLTLFFPHQGPTSFATLTTPEAVQAFLSDTFPDAMTMMPDATELFFQNPTGHMVTVKASPWNYRDQLLLIGDAAHAIVPFYGQGMNCAFEDASSLARLMDAQKTRDWGALFAATATERKPNADAIADMALENFVEMRATVADPKFQLKKQIGFELERRFPERFIPRYSMVVFHPEISYAEARRRGIAQDDMLAQLAQGHHTLETIDWAEAERLVQALGA